MSALIDRFRTLAANLFAKFGVPATITGEANPTRDRYAGTITPGAATSRSVLAVLGKREDTTDDGVMRSALPAKLNGAAKAGETLAIGGDTYTITDVKTVNPDGGVPLQWEVKLK